MAKIETLELAVKGGELVFLAVDALMARKLTALGQMATEADAIT